MRTISVSTDVYAKIWSLRDEQEEDENTILRRVLWLPNRQYGTKNEGIGFMDARHRVSFEEGFEIFRNYLGSEFRAIASSGQWKLINNGKMYGSLNELSRAIGTKIENAWVNWNYLDKQGRQHKVAELRETSQGSSNPKPTQETKMQRGGLNSATWVDDLVEAFQSLGKAQVTLNELYSEVRKIRVSEGRSIPRTFESVVRERLESHSSDSESFKGGADLFSMPQGKGNGIWSLRAIIEV